MDFVCCIMKKNIALAPEIVHDNELMIHRNIEKITYLISCSAVTALRLHLALIALNHKI